MSNSPLVSHIRLSPNSSIRTAKIDSIIIHHMGSTAATIESVGADFARKERKASSNYGIGSDGRIALYVEESRRSWCSNNWQADNRSITVEIQNSGKGPDWAVSDAAVEAAIALCADICRRNNIPRLNYTGDKSGNLTMHRWYASTVCPGNYLAGKFPYIAQEVNRRLGVTNNPVAEREDLAELQVGDEITLVPGTRYTTGKEVPGWVMKKTIYCRSITGENVTFSILKTGAITGTTSKVNVRKAGQAVAAPEQPRQEAAFTVGDCVSLTTDACYVSGKAVPEWVKKRKVYVRQICSNGNIVFSIFKTGGVTGTTLQKYLKKI